MQKSQFQAAMFDFDGTITELGDYAPPQKMASALVALAQKMPIAFCTGRQLESFVHRGLTALLEEIEPEQREPFLKNLYLFAENGAVGYEFNSKKHEFEEFYRVPWPVELIERSKMMDILGEAVKEFGSVYYNAHKVVIVVRTNLHDVRDRKIRDVEELSGKIYEIALDSLREVNPDYEKYVHVGNSGIGVIVGPADGDKDKAIVEFASFLRKNRRFEIGPEAREIIAIGDSPLPSGNDHNFLRGEYGSTYTVGDLIEGAAWPKPVVSGNERLLNVEGTLYLINKILAESAID